jgi:hypothetical protein
MKIKNCKLINSIKVVAKELTYIESSERSGIELTLVAGFIKVKTPRLVKLVPLSNVTDMQVDISDEQTQNGKGSEEGSNGGSPA